MNAGGQDQQQQQQNMLLQAQQQHAMPEPSTASVESSAHSGPTGTTAGNMDQRELVWTKLQLLKDKYLQDMNELYGMLSNRCTQPMPAEHLRKLKHYEDTVQRMIPYLRVSKDRIPKEFDQDKLHAFEKQIVIIMETFKKTRQPQAAPGQPPPAPQAPARLSSSMNARGQQQSQNMLLQAQQPRAMPEPSTAHSGPTGTAAGNVDQSELVWTKLQLLKDKYLQHMNELYGMLSNRCTQPMPAEHLQKLKHYKDVLQRMIPYLRVSKDRVPKELKVDVFEKGIVNILEAFKKRPGYIHKQPQAAPGGPAAPGQPPPAPQIPAQPAPVQRPDHVNMAGNWFSFGGFGQAPSQMPQNGQILRRVPSTDRLMQLRLLQRHQQQQLQHQQQQLQNRQQQE